MLDWFLGLFDFFSSDEVNDIAEHAYDDGFEDGQELMNDLLDHY